MKRLGLLLSVLLLCTMFGLSANHNTASAKVSITQIRKQCSTEAKARKYMKKISFKVWDIQGKKKVTKTKTILIHKSIANKVKKTFDKIYEGDEKFPIKSVGGYSWRGSTKSLHSLGLAVDINENENYMIDGRTVLCGTLWKPGQNPYSIPKKGDVMRSMKANGLKQCIWGSRKDYMHFSVGGY